MELELSQLLKGKATLIKNKEYFSAEQYVTPFLNRMSSLTDNFIIKVKPAEQVSLTKEGDINFEDAVYNRVWIQGVLPGEYCWDNHQESISLLYALDTRKPVVKIFRNALNMACLNLCVFNPQLLSVQELEPETAINYSFLDQIRSITDNTREKLTKLSEMEFTKDNMFRELGLQIDRCINYKMKNDFGTIKLAESTPVEAYKNVFYNDKSDYYTPDDRVDGFTLYNAFTDLISNDKDRDIVNKFEKIKIIGDILGV